MCKVDFKCKRGYNVRVGSLQPIKSNRGNIYRVRKKTGIDKGIRGKTKYGTVPTGACTNADEQCTKLYAANAASF